MLEPKSRIPLLLNQNHCLLSGFDCKWTTHHMSCWHLLGHVMRLHGNPVQVITISRGLIKIHGGGSEQVVMWAVPHCSSLKEGQAQSHKNAARATIHSLWCWGGACLLHCTGFVYIWLSRRRWGMKSIYFTQLFISVGKWTGIRQQTKTHHSVVITGFGTQTNTLICLLAACSLNPITVWFKGIKDSQASETIYIPFSSDCTVFPYDCPDTYKHHRSPQYRAEDKSSWLKENRFPKK